jgi:hypothetical protein
MGLKLTDVEDAAQTPWLRSASDIFIDGIVINARRIISFVLDEPVFARNVSHRRPTSGAAPRVSASSLGWLLPSKYSPCEILSLPSSDQQLWNVPNVVESDMPKMSLGPLRVECCPLLQTKPWQQHLLEYQALDSRRVPGSDLVRSGGSPIFANDMELVMAEFRHQLSDIIRHRRHVVSVIRVCRVANTTEIRHHYGKVFRQ